MKNVRTRALLALLWCAGIPLACSGGGAVNIGNTNAVGSQLSDYAATWDGYAEAYTFMPDGSDRVRLTIAANGQGTFEVGNAALLQPPTDPNVGYPPGEPDPVIGPNPGLSGGALYPIYAARVQENRIQAGLKPNDYYGAWCTLQTPYRVLEGYTSSSVQGQDGGQAGVDGGRPSDDGGQPGAGGLVPIFDYRCLPSLGGGVSGEGTAEVCSIQIDSTDGSVSFQSVDCGKEGLCARNVCACTETLCTASPVVPAGTLPSGYPVELDAALDSTGKTLTGTLALSTDLRVTVVLTKQ